MISFLAVSNSFVLLFVNLGHDSFPFFSFLASAAVFVIETGGQFSLSNWLQLQKLKVNAQFAFFHRIVSAVVRLHLVTLRLLKCRQI